MYQVIEKLMQEHGETPAELSKATGIPLNAICNWKYRESKGGKMSLENAAKIAKHFEVSIDELLKGVGD